MQPQVKIWKDKGENIGVQCLVCYRTHWTGKEPNTDPTTGEPCSNCEAIETAGLLVAETDKHKQELAQWKTDREALVSEGKDTHSAVLACSHLPSQP